MFKKKAMADAIPISEGAKITRFVGIPIEKRFSCRTISPALTPLNLEPHCRRGLEDAADE